MEKKFLTYIDGEPFVSTLVFAEQIGLPVQKINDIIEENMNLFKQDGEIIRKTSAKFLQNPIHYYFLNELQTYLLYTMLQDDPHILRFKFQLLREFGRDQEFLNIVHEEHMKQEQKQDLVVINDVEMPIRTYKDQKVVTFKDISRVHNCKITNLRSNFSNNKKHFIEGVDYFLITDRMLVKNFDEHKKTPKINVFTESGYLMLVKSLTDDTAWKVQRDLVNTYFKFKEGKQIYQESLQNDFTHLGEMSQIINYMFEFNDSQTKFNSNQVGMNTAQIKVNKFFTDELLNLHRKIDKIEKSQRYSVSPSTEQQIDNLLLGNKQVNKLTDRMKLNEVIRLYGVTNRYNKDQFRGCYNKLYVQFRDRYHIDVKRRAKNRRAKGEKIRPLDIIDELGLMSDAFSLAVELFPITKTS